MRRLVDQIVFLRVAEAKSGQILLRHCFECDFNFDEYRSLLNRSRQVFNSELFNNFPSLPSRLGDEQKGLFTYVLREIIAEMYPPACPYEFSLVPHDIFLRHTRDFLGPLFASVLQLTGLQKYEMENVAATSEYTILKTMLPSILLRKQWRLLFHIESIRL